MSTATAAVEIVEVAPRDGFQPIGPWIPTETKIAFLRRLAAAGLRRIEIGSFVSAAAVPQLRDAAELLAAAAEHAGPAAAGAGADRAARPRRGGGRGALPVYVLSVSEAHNRSNVRRSVGGVRWRTTPACSTGCRPRSRCGSTSPPPSTAPSRDGCRSARCSTCSGGSWRCGPMSRSASATPRAAPRRTMWRSSRRRRRRCFPQVAAWAFHAHDTYGLGLATTYAAYREGVRVFDAAAGGLGGCPFAPGATGNVATEDVVWMFERMGIGTGVDLGALLPVAQDAAALPGASAGGRARDALLAGAAAACAAPRAGGGSGERLTRADGGTAEEGKSREEA